MGTERGHFFTAVSCEKAKRKGRTMFKTEDALNSRDVHEIHPINEIHPTDNMSAEDRIVAATDLAARVSVLRRIYHRHEQMSSYEQSIDLDTIADIFGWSRNKGVGYGN